METYIEHSGAIMVPIMVLICGLYFLKISKRGQLPPGPVPLPVIGNLLHLRKGGAREPVRQLAAKYGDVMLLYMGSKPVVFLCSYSAIKEAFVKRADVFSARPKGDLFLDIMPGQGIAGISGEKWREQRHFTHGILRDFGMGKKIIEEKIQQEISYLIPELLKNHGRSFSPVSTMTAAVSNIIQGVVVGSRAEYSDEINTERLRIIDETTILSGSSGLRNLLPFLKYAPGDFFKFKLLRRNISFLLGSYQQMMDDHKCSGADGEIRDFIDAYQQEIEKRKHDPQSNYKDPQLKKIIYELFSAGTETTSNTLSWGLIFMLHNPEVMAKVQEEIDDVIGRERMPTMQDKQELRYTVATVMEIQRMADITFMGLPHCTTDDVVFRGYHIPKDTTVIASLYCVHRDPRLWHEPESFRPERFLDEQGNLKKSEHLVPFNMGKRSCVAEALAKAEIFLFFVAMMQRLNIRNPDGRPLPDLQGNIGILYAARDFEICVSKRE